MKLCVITGTLPPAKCGVGDYSEALYSALIKNYDVDLDIITSKGNKYDGTSLDIHDIVEKWEFSNLKVILHKIKQINPDLIHIQYPTSAYGKNVFINILPVILKFKGYKLVSTIHEYSDNSKIGKIRIWPNILLSDSIIVVDEQYINDIRKMYIFKNKYIKFINIGSNIPKASISMEERIDIRNKIIQGKHSNIMSYFGFIHEKKGIEYVIYSLKDLKSKGLLKTKFLIIGELNTQNEYHNSILNLINNLNLNEDIYVTGYLPKEEVSKYLNASDFAIFPFVDGLSYKNGSFLAAYQEGLPTITTNPRNNIEVNNVFYLSRYDNIHEISDYILKLQSDFNQNSKKNSNNSLNVDWNSIAQEHYKLYKYVLNGE